MLPLNGTGPSWSEIRMNRTGQGDYIAFGEFQLNLTDRILGQRGSPVPLSPKEFETLRLLVERSPHVVTKEEFVSQIWPDTFVGDSSLARNISVLRKLLGEGLIETVAKRGYRFTEPVFDTPGALVEGKATTQEKELKIDIQADMVLPEVLSGTSLGPPVQSSKWRFLVAVGLTFIAMGALVSWHLRHTNRDWFLIGSD
jgi:DNA-binding winged helix-turn-helix (wHTH) protein